jgi:acetyltransferase-like isoleucine patch superfamily enzyme
MINLNSLITRTIGLIISIPFRLLGGKLAWSSMLGPGYSFLGCNLRYVYIAPNVMIGSRAWIQTVVVEGRDIPKVLIEENTFIGRNVVISAAKSIVVKKNCVLSYNVSLLDHSHNFEDPRIPLSESGISFGREILIGSGCFIGAHSFILPGVRLGSNCVVGANSVVSESFPDRSVIAGAPAKLLRTLKAIH